MVDTLDLASLLRGTCASEGKDQNYTLRELLRSAAEGTGLVITGKLRKASVRKLVMRSEGQRGGSRVRRSVVDKGLEPGRNFVGGKLYRTVWPVNEECRQLFPNPVGMYRSLLGGVS